MAAFNAAAERLKIEMHYVNMKLIKSGGIVEVHPTLIAVYSQLNQYLFNALNSPLK
jgi:hypothetical protein